MLEDRDQTCVGTMSKELMSDDCPKANSFTIWEEEGDGERNCDFSMVSTFALKT